MFRTLLEACRAVGDCESASRVQRTIEQLGLFARMPVASTLVQGVERQYQNGMSGSGDAEAGNVWLALRQQTTYTPQLRALPWAFAQNNT